MFLPPAPHLSSKLCRGALPRTVSRYVCVIEYMTVILTLAYLDFPMVTQPFGRNIRRMGVTLVRFFTPSLSLYA